jgi:AraC-like DNA-binding protein
MTHRNARSTAQLPGTVVNTLFSAMIDFASTLGAPRSELVARAGIDEADLAVEGRRLPMAAYARLVRSAKDLTGEPGLPVLFASHADFSEVSIAGLIANASETMLDSLMQLNRYGRLTIDTPFEGETALVFERTASADWIFDTRFAARAFPELVELAFTFLITGPRRFLPEPHILSVQLAYDEPAHARTYRDIWDCPIQFNAPRNGLQVPNWVADHKVRLQPAYAFGILTAHADGMLEKLQAVETFSGRLEALVLPALHTGDVTVAWAAAQLGVSRQSIYRQLKAEAKTFEGVLDDLRHRLALEYLTGQKVSIAETAYLLGFSEASPFTRAFKRWTGQAPGAYQKTALTPPDL